MFDGDGVVEVNDGVDGAEGSAGFEEAPVERFVGLGIFLGGDVAFCFEGVAISDDARVGLRVRIGGEGGEGFRGDLLFEVKGQFWLSARLAHQKKEVGAFVFSPFQLTALPRRIGSLRNWFRCC